MNLWERILDKLKTRINPQNFATWFRPTGFASMDGNTLTVVVPNKYFKEWIIEEFSEDLTRALEEIATEEQGALDVRSLRFDFVASQTGTTLAHAADHDEDEARPVVREGSVNLTNPHLLNARYTFESFVVGNSNQFAHAASRRVSESPSTGYNPLFLYGGVGLGKTHLMHAIGHSILASGRRLRLTYISSERFMNELIHAIRTEKMIDFRGRYRRCDVLLVDDIQFLQGKERTQEEFFHTFNELHESGKQIVISSDRPPAEIPAIEERLRSRFSWGLSADIQPPELETKIAIIEKKAEAEGICVPQDVALFIASRVKSNIRELEGSLIRLIALCSLTGKPISIDHAREALVDLLGSDDRPVTIARIQKHVATYYDLRPADLKSRTNQKAITFPRQVAMWLSKRMTRASFPEIGREFGGKHHSTVIHSVKKIEALRTSDPELNRVLNSLSESL